MPLPESALAVLHKANELAEQRKFNAAFYQFERVIRRHYGNSEAHIDFASALCKAGRFPDAVKQFRKAVDFDPSIAFDVDQLVHAFSHDVAHQEDMEEFQKTVDNRDRPELFHQWAQVLGKLQHGNRAIEEFKKVLKKNPELELDTDSLVQAFNDGKKIKEQIQAFQKDVDKANNGRAWNTWGKALLGLERNALAAKQFEKAAAVRTDWAEPKVNLGLSLISLGEYQQALDVLRKALELDPHSVSVYLYLGKAFDEIGQYALAVSNYELAAVKAPSGQYFGPWLESLKKLSNPDDAIGKYHEALVSYGSSSDSYSSLGEFLEERGQLAQSARAFACSMALANHNETGLQLQRTLSELANPQPVLNEIQKFFDAYGPHEQLKLALVLARLNDLDRVKHQLANVLSHLSVRHFEAMKDVVRSFKSSEHRHVLQSQIQEGLNKLNKGDLDVQWARMLVEDLNDSEQGLAQFQKVILTAPASSGLVAALAAALKKSPSQASVIERIQSAVDDSSNPAVTYQWALVLINLEQSKPAIQQLQRSISLDPSQPEAHYQLARLHHQQGNYTKACGEFQKTLESNHNHPDALQDWGASLLKAGRREEAIEKYLQLVTEHGRLLASPQKLNWNDQLVARFQKVVDDVQKADTYEQWGRLLRGIKRPELAIQQFKEAVELNPDAMEVYSEWFKALGMLGLPADGLAEYEEAIVEYRNDAGAFSELGEFLFRLKQSEQVVKRAKQALERDPKDVWARLLLIDGLVLANSFNEARKEALELLADDPLNIAAHDSLSWMAFADGDYEEAVKQAELGLEKGEGDSISLYYRSAQALYKSGRGDLARAKLDEALTKDPDNVDTHYQLGQMLMEMNRYDEATTVFSKVVALDPNHTSANHSLAAIAYNQGRYEEAWKKVTHAIGVYEQQRPLLPRVIEKNEFVDSYESFNHASLILAIQSNKYQEAEAVLKEGQDFDPYNAATLRALAELHWEKKDEAGGPDSENRWKSECHWNGMDYFQRAERLLQEQLQRCSNIFLLIDQGDLYLAHEDYDKARTSFEKARAIDEKAYVPLARLGLVSLRERQPDKAIPLFQESLKRNPDQLDVRSSLAEAYLRAEKLEDAETTYRQVLNIAPNHVQSYIGMGEISIALGDKKDFDRYAEGIEHFTKALEIAGNEKIRSKYLKKQDKAAVYYQRGYARVQSYESLGIRRDTKLLKQARKDFDDCLLFSPSHQKAKRAKEKIDKRFSYFSRDNLTETIGPLTIYSMSIVIFVAVQLAFYVAPWFNQPSLLVSDKSLQAVAKQVQPEVAQTLAVLKNQKFQNREELEKTLEPLLKTDVEKVKEAVLQNAEVVKPIEEFAELGGGYYALLTFGSLLFMVVGLYLPQILKLKVAGIELEKSSIDQAATAGPLAISRL